MLLLLVHYRQLLSSFVYQSIFEISTCIHLAPLMHQPMAKRQTNRLSDHGVLRTHPMLIPSTNPTWLAGKSSIHRYIYIYIILYIYYILYIYTLFHYFPMIISISHLVRGFPTFDDFWKRILSPEPFPPPGLHDLYLVAEWSWGFL